MQQIQFCSQQITELHTLINLLSLNPLSKHEEQISGIQPPSAI